MDETPETSSEDEQTLAEEVTHTEDEESRSETQDSDSEQESRYQEGQVLRFVKVRFPGNAKSFPFAIGKRHIGYGQKVLAMSDRGMAVGYVNSFPYELCFHKSMLPVKHISRLATDDDIDQAESSFDKEQQAEELCKDLIKKYQLNMEITHVEQTQFGKKTVFYFVAPHRVDFRALVKDLVKSLKTRIELRQISIRDRAASLGGIGPCGLSLCCSTFLNRFGNVNIRMAKNQNLTLNPTRLNGLCGQLKCCTAYEDDVYTYKRKSMPKENKYIQTLNGDRGKVLKLHILIEQFDMLTDKGEIRRYTADQFSKEQTLPEDWKFPESFGHILNETQKVIGLVEKSTGQQIESSIDQLQTQMHGHFDDEDLDDDDLIDIQTEFSNLDKETRRARYRDSGDRQLSAYDSEHSSTKQSHRDKPRDKKSSDRHDRSRSNRRRGGRYKNKSNRSPKQD